MEIYSKHNFTQNLPNVLRKCSYFMIHDRRSGKQSFVRKLGRGHYPRFHIYVKKDSPGDLHLNLHLDMKKESYSGVSAHSGEYDSDTVKQEYMRIMNIFKQYLQKAAPPQSQAKEESSKKSFWQKLTGQ